MSNFNLNGMMRLIRAIRGIANPVKEKQHLSPIGEDLRNDSARNEKLQRTATLGMPASVPSKLKPNPRKILMLRAKPLRKNK